MFRAVNTFSAPVMMRRGGLGRGLPLYFGSAKATVSLLLQTSSAEQGRALHCKAVHPLPCKHLGEGLHRTLSTGRTITAPPWRGVQGIGGTWRRGGTVTFELQPKLQGFRNDITLDNFGPEEGSTSRLVELRNEGGTQLGTKWSLSQSYASWRARRSSSRESMVRHFSVSWQGSLYSQQQH